MKKYIAIDGGTTNIRMFYTADNEILETLKKPVGVAHGTGLKETCRDEISRLIHQYGKPDAIIASGMITSERGLYALPHFPLPAGIRELHNGMKNVKLTDIAEQDITFIPGLKQENEDFRNCDIMRGEECEVIGLAGYVDSLPDGNQSRKNTGNSSDGCTYVLPGSHSKHIKMKNGKVVSFSTFLSGEMVSALSDGTILKFSVDKTQALCTEALCEGCAFAAEEGMGKALFKVRILDTIYRADPSRIYSFFLGAVLADEIAALLKDDSPRIILAGQPRLQEATAALLRQSAHDKKIVQIPADTSAEANVRGMIRIYEA